MIRKIVEHFAATGETIERDMTEEEEAQADLDEQSPKQWQNDDLAG
jgi:hypothetical protein